MTKFLATTTLLAALIAPVSAVADPGETGRFTRDGVTYVYTRTTRQDRVVLDGHSYPSGNVFHLVIHGDRVSGTSNDVPVAFLVSDSHAGASETLASR